MEVILLEVRTVFGVLEPSSGHAKEVRKLMRFPIGIDQLACNKVLKLNSANAAIISAYGALQSGSVGDICGMTIYISALVAVVLGSAFIWYSRRKNRDPNRKRHPPGPRGIPSWAEGQHLMEAIGKFHGAPMLPRDLMLRSACNNVVTFLLGRRLDLDDPRRKDMDDHLEGFFLGSAASSIDCRPQWLKKLERWLRPRSPRVRIENMANELEAMSK
ncbi:hypothetical protein HPB50_007087 [Hyalomma asiaticum]|uniref:Uncharacterized protein n=1 Tax=Hyalomma asiaticum TaxID=266040 RepID=A0ACB7RM42_HYAAI|nr:hypothetical protein HPB50_007087 [Hyalomma asiaticum]